MRVTEQAARTYQTPNGEVKSLAGLTYRSANWGEHLDNPNRWRATMLDVTGAHNAKIGYQGLYMVVYIENHGNDLNLVYMFNNARPSQLTQSLRVFNQKDRVRWNAVYVEDQWTRGRMTMQGALRFDSARSYSPAQTIGPTDFPAHAAAISGDAWRRLVQGHLAARRRGV